MGRFEDITTGDSAAHVLARIGEPQRIHERTVTEGRVVAYLEVWVYDGGNEITLRDGKVAGYSEGRRWKS